MFHKLGGSGYISLQGFRESIEKLLSLARANLARAELMRMKFFGGYVAEQFGNSHKIIPCVPTDAYVFSIAPFVRISDKRKLNIPIQSQSYFVITSFLIYSR